MLSECEWECFFALDAGTRARILQARDAYLEQREQRFANLASAMELETWGDEVTCFCGNKCEPNANGFLD